MKIEKLYKEDDNSYEKYIFYKKKKKNKKKKQNDYYDYDSFENDVEKRIKMNYIKKKK